MGGTRWLRCFVASQEFGLHLFSRLLCDGRASEINQAQEAKRGNPVSSHT